MRCEARRAGVWAATALVALALAGCETTAEKSARLARGARHVVLARQGLTVTRQNPDVKLLASAALHDQNGAAVAVTLLNTSSRPLADLPIAFTVKDSAGAVVYQNNQPGLESSLTSISLLLPHRPFTWVDDQLQAGSAASVSVRVGLAAAAVPSPAAAAAQIAVNGVHAINDSTNGPGAAGTLQNRSGLVQQNEVVYAVARRANRIVAAGRAVLPTLPTGSATPFQVFFIGDPRGAQLQVAAPTTTF